MTVEWVMGLVERKSKPWFSQFSESLAGCERKSKPLL